MPETPTSEGSIVAYLRVNDSDWNAKLDAAEQKARDLGRISPNIRVTADTADAIAKLDAARLAAERVGGSHVTTITTVNESVSNATGSGRASQAAAMDAVTAANKRLEAAENAAGLAADRHALSIMRLNDALAKGNITETQRASLELTEASAQTRLAQAQDRVADAAAKVAAAESAAAAATDSQGAAADKAANGNKANLGYMGMIVAAMALLVPLASELAGYVAGVGGAFLGMGAAGVLAVLGIKNEMAQATTQGYGLTALIDSVTNALGSLETTAAAGVLGAFQQAIANINIALPQLNMEIGGFATILGSTAATVVQTLISGFQVLNPLFMQGAQHIASLASAWAAWVNNGGLEKFAQGAEQSLPIVANALGSLATLALHLIEALSPLGGFVLDTITALANALNSLPVGLLSDLALGAAAAFGAFKMWGLLAPIIGAVAKAVGAVGLATEVATGPIGWVIAAVGVAVTAFTALTSSTQSAAGATDDYAAALEQSNGVLDENIRKTIAKQLSDEGVLAIARQYGISLPTVTDAVMGHTDAINTVNAAIQKYGMTQVDVHGQDGAITNSYTTMTDKARKLSDAISGQNSALRQQVQAYQDQQAAAQGVTAETQWMNSLTQSVNDATAAAKAWKAEQDLINGTAQTVEQTTIKLAGDFITAQNDIQTALKTVDKATATSLDVNTQYGNQNHQLILQAVQDAQAKADAIVQSEVQQGISTVKAHNDGQAALEAEKQAIIDHMTALGMDKNAVTQLVDAELQIPPQITQTFTLVGVEAGEQKLSDYLQLVNSIHDITQRITVEANYVGGAQNLASTYGTKQMFASGGTVGGPGSATSDSVNALLSRTEEVVSNGSGQADRWRSALKLINQNAAPSKIASQVMRIAGVTPQTAAPVVHQHTWYITTNNGEQLFQTFQAKVNALAGP